jgi:hypothetical protein
MRKACVFGLLALGFIALITTRHMAASLSVVQAKLTGASISADYQIASDVLAGAGGNSSSIHYCLDDSIGQPEALGSSQSANYKVWPAYWHTINVPDIPAAVSDLSITKSGDNAVLSWSAVTTDVDGNALSVDHYVVYRQANEPYFTPTPSDILADNVTNTDFTDTSALGDAVNHYFYVIKAVSAAGRASSASNRIGEFDYTLVPGASASNRRYNFVALSVSVTDITDADSLASYVGSGVYMVLKWNASDNSWTWRIPGGAGTNFSTQIGEVYLLSLTDAAPSNLSLVGDVPDQQSVTFTLVPGASASDRRYNFVSLPLDKGELTTADQLANDIGGVYMILKWDASTQSWVWRIPDGPGTNFSVGIGNPYLVSLTDAAPTTWPSY